MTKIACPNCASTNTCRIVYGMVAFDEKLDADLRAGKIHLAGCGISDDAPNRHCNDCETDFSTEAL